MLQKYNESNIFKSISLTSSYLLVIMGLTIMIGWFTKNQTITQINPIYAPTHFNTALSIFLMGMTIILTLYKKHKLVAVPSSFVFVIASATIGEYMFNVNLGIDELFSEDYLFVKTSSPGRMGLNTALCLMIGSFGLLISSLNFFKKHFYYILFSISGAIGFIATISLVGYYIGLEAAYGWGHWTRMSLNTSISFSILSIALFSWLWHSFEKKSILNSTIQWRLIIRILVPIVIIYVVDSIADISHLKTVTEQKTDAELTTLSYQFAEKIDKNLFNATEMLIEAKRELLITDSVTEEHIYQLLEHIVDSDSLIYGSALLFNKFEYDTTKRLYGPYVHKPESQLIRLDLANEIDYFKDECEWFNKAEKAGKAVWTEPYFDEGITDILLCTYSLPIYHEKDLWAVITLDLHLEELPTLMGIDTSDELQYYIVSNEGSFLFNSTRPNLVGLNHYENDIQYDYDVADRLPDLISTNVSGRFEYIGNQSKNENWLYYIPINSAPWKVYLGISEYNAIEEVRVEILNQLLMLLLVIVVLIIVIVLISKTITQPIKLLNTAVKNVAEGDYNTIIETNAKNEVGYLAKSFNLMNTKLHRRENELIEKEKRYRALIESSNTGAWEYNSETNFLWCSNEYFTMLGRNEADYDLSRNDNLKEVWLDLLHPEDREKAEKQFANYLKGGSVGMYESVFRMKHKEGYWVWIWSRARTLKSEDNSLKSKTVGTHIDISKQKHTEEMQQQLVHEVGERMKELNCLYEIYKMIDGEGTTITDLLSDIVNVIPKAWQYIDITCTKISFLNRDYLSDNFMTSDWSLKEDILINGEVSGSIEVYYIEERPPSDIGPFMKEEKLLIEAIALQISNFYIRKTAVDGLLKSKEDLEDKVAERTVELQETEEKNRLILESAGEGILGVDLHGNITFVNSSAIRMLGYRQSEMIGESVHDLIHSKSPDGSNYPVEDCPMYKTYTLGSTNNVDTEVLWRKDGSSFPVNYTSKPITKDGDCLGAVITFTDITERRLAEDKNLKLLTAVEKSPVMVSIATPEGVVDYVNPQYSAVTGFSSNDVVGKTHSLLKTGVLSKHKYEEIYKHIQSAKIWSGELQSRKKDGSHFWSSLSLTGVHDNVGKLTHMVIIEEDITERKGFEFKLASAKEMAEEATKAKSEFLATMSHEIRTPMNAIIGLSQLALATNLDAKQFDYIKKVNSSGHALLGIINDILDFSKVEAGKLNFESIDFDLEQVFEEHANVVTYNAHEKGLEFVLGIGKNVPLSIVGDPLRLRQVLVNLVNNAIKFTHEGEISVLANLVEETEESVIIEFSVNDTGIGIGEEKLNKLFKSFSQADASTTRKYGGSGLGLAICKGIIEAQNGEIWVKSIEGKGSSFGFTLPFKKQKTQKKDQFKPSPDVYGLRVLLCDDNATALEILENTLEDLSFKVTAVRSGAEVIRMLDENIDNPFDLLLLDWKMPEMDGIETIKVLKAKFGAKILPSIIMVTAYNSDEIYQDVKDMDISGLLVKPVNHSTLLNGIMTAFGKIDDVKTFNKSDLNYKVGKVADIKGASVLLVEDNDINQQVAQELLETAGINVDIAENGQVAVNMLKKDAHKYQLVFMDIQMPVMDGYTATSQIREDLKLLDIPIVAMTADAITGVKGKCLKVGMNDFITKPIDTDNLYNTLKKHIRKGTFKPEIMDVSNVKIEEVHIPEFKNISVAEGLGRVNNNRQLYADLLTKFYNRYHAFKQDVADIVSKPDELKRYIHTLKGTSGNIGAVDLHKATVSLELNIHKPEFEVLLQSYHSELSLLMNELETFVKAQVILDDLTTQNSSQQALSKEDIASDLNKLKNLVRNNDLDASDTLKDILNKKLNPEIKGKLTEVLEVIDAFDFEVANDLLLKLND